MALSIRLTRVGRRKSPHYRVVVAEARMPRDGRFVEIIGHYQPLRAEIKLEIKEDRALHWLHIGAQPSDTVRSLLRKKGVMQKWHEEWLKEAYRVLKPGGYLVAFGGTRTYHRLACAMEDVGFEIRDTMQWIYGSGFPKSLDISKAIDKRKGAERKVVEKRTLNSNLFAVSGEGIEQEKYRYAYGRKFGSKRMKKTIIKLPVTKEGLPDWLFMENYIKSLSYSANIYSNKL